MKHGQDHRAYELDQDMHANKYNKGLCKCRWQVTHGRAGIVMGPGGRGGERREEVVGLEQSPGSPVDL